MDKDKKSLLDFGKYKKLNLILAGASAIFAAWMTWMTLSLFETDIQYFRAGTPWPLLFAVLLVAYIVLAFAAMFFVAKKELPRDYPAAGAATVFSAALSGFMLAACGVFEIADMLTAEPTVGALGVQRSGLALLFSTRSNTVRTLAVVFSLLCIVYFIMSAFPTKTKPRSRAAFGFGVIAFFICRLLALYYDLTLPINSPVRMLDQMANVAAMLYFVYELRFLLPDPRPGLYVSFSVISFTLLLSSSSAQIIAAATGKFELSAQTVSAFFELALAVYILARLLDYLCTPREKPETESTDAPATDAE